MKLLYLLLELVHQLNAERVNSGTAIFVRDKFFIFDVGDGVVQQAEKMNLPLNELDGVFVTHYHSDHYIDLPYLINRSWVSRKK